MCAELTVDLLAGQWRRAIPGQGMEVTDYIFPTEVSQLKCFIDKHDRVTDQLEALAAKDDLLTGMYELFYWEAGASKRSHQTGLSIRCS